MTAPNSTVSDELKPCPFCGGEVQMTDLDDEDERRIWVRYIECETCDLKMRDWTGWPGKGEVFDRDKMSDQVGQSLAKAWNTRSLSTGTDAGVRVPVITDEVVFFAMQAADVVGQPMDDIDIRAVLSAAFRAAYGAEAETDDETYEIGKRDGYEQAVQDIDCLTGGDGEYRYCTDHDPDRHTPDAETMKARIVERFSALEQQPAASQEIMPEDLERTEEEVKRLLGQDKASPGMEVEQGSCASCNGTGVLGGNPGYGVLCPDCDGAGKFPPPTPTSKGEVPEDMGDEALYAWLYPYVCDDGQTRILIGEMRQRFSTPTSKGEVSEATHRHKKRGTEYVLIGIGKMQAEQWVDRKPAIDGLMRKPPVVRLPSPVDMREVAIYRSVDDGSLWVRPREEFEDGRFEILTGKEA